jgi:hypothetical protein
VAHLLAQIEGLAAQPGTARAVRKTPAIHDPKRPIRRRLERILNFVTNRGREYCFMPGPRALRWLADLHT